MEGWLLLNEDSGDEEGELYLEDFYEMGGKLFLMWGKSKRDALFCSMQFARNIKAYLAKSGIKVEIERVCF